MANILSEKNINPDIIISSDAVRAKEFAFVIASVLGYSSEDILFSRDLYLANEFEMLKTVKEVNDEKETVFLVSHNPGITYFANLLCNYNLENLPTSGIFGIEFDLKSWKETAFGNGQFLMFEFPKKYI
jgi:phosphohistidine phosphatase